MAAMKRADGLISISEAARRLDRTPRHVYRLIHRGELKALTESGDWRVREREFSRYLDALERRAAGGKAVGAR